MATYVIGDIQGCADAFFSLLEKCKFQAERDRLWVVGDLVNRGPDNVSVLRYLMSLPKEKTAVVLGNHDLHLLATAYAQKTASKKDTLADVLDAPNRSELLTWLRHQKLAYQENGFVMSHAGIPHIWSTDQAMSLAHEVEKALRSEDFVEFLKNMYGNEPSTWSDDLVGFERLRVITNYFTRMRFIAPDGALDFAAKEGLSSTPTGMKPWFEYDRHHDQFTYIFGHWAALKGQSNNEKFIATDTGCVWGGCLSAHRLEDKQIFSVSC